MQNEIDEVIVTKKYYDSNSEKEWNRLEGFRFEFEITKFFLNKYLKGKTVLDIGGGPGRYSIYLSKLGYDVTLVDLSEGNIEFLKKKTKELKISNIKSYQCDARDLSKLNLDKFDNILIMGPLYHLFKETDREKCVLEAKKLLKDDGVLFVYFISIQAGLNYYLDVAPEKIINEPDKSLFDFMEKDENWSGTAFTKCIFINNCLIVDFFKKLGFEKLTLFGQEGVTGTRLEYIQKSSEEVRKFYLEISLKLCENPQYFSYSNHIMYIGKKNLNYK